MDNYPPCPYKSSFRKICVHKAGKTKISKKRRCSYKKPQNCPLYRDWLEIKLSCSRLAKNGYNDYNEGIDD